MYIGNYYVMYNIGQNIPSLLDRTLIKCEKVYWYRPNVGNKLPVFFIPVEITNMDIIKQLPYKNIISPSNKYYLATIENGHVLVIYKGMDESFYSDHWSNRTASMIYTILPT